MKEGAACIAGGSDQEPHPESASSYGNLGMKQAPQSHGPPLWVQGQDPGRCTSRAQGPVRKAPQAFKKAVSSDQDTEGDQGAGPLGPNAHPTPSTRQTDSALSAQVHLAGGAHQGNRQGCPGDPVMALTATPPVSGQRWGSLGRGRQCCSGTPHSSQPLHSDPWPSLQDLGGTGTPCRCPT